MRSRIVLGGMFLAAFVAALAPAQTIDFRLSVSENGQAALIPNASDIPFTAPVGGQESATVTATYIGNSVATITQPPQQLGSNEFTITSNLTTPQTFTPGQSFTITIVYAPTNASQANGEVSVNYTEPGTGANSGTPVQNTILIGLVGTSPAYTLSYILQSTKNGAVIPSGGTIPFGPTQINTPALADLIITDTGSGPGAVIGITTPPAGSPFQVQGLPPLGPTDPYVLEANQANNLELVIQYTPTAVETDTASIQITFQGGITETVNLSGNGITSSFTYKVLIQGQPTKTVASGGTITFPSANVGSTSSLILTIDNTGSASGTINSISVNPPFSITSPITLPVTLTTGNSFSVPLTFTPTGVGTQTGYLVVGNTTFTLVGQGLGPNLTYSYTSSGSTVTVTPPNGAVLFSTIPVGQSEKVTFTITNSGTLPATISLIEPNPVSGPFTVSSVALPKTLQAGQSISVTLTFTPTVTGVSTATLVVNTTDITLQGAASAPATLPSYTISGPSGNVQPDTQSNVSLTLSKAYPIDLTGTLTITTQGTLGTDPTVQFQTGGRTVDFTIPAGSTSADFAGQGTTVGVQTGTVAETVTLAPTFTTSGGTVVTPASPDTLQFTIPSEAPVLLDAVVTGVSDNSFTLVLTGYSTTRSLASLNVTLTAAAGYNIQTSVPAINISGVAGAWFGLAASEAIGGLFQITESFVLQGTVKTGQTLIQSIAGVTATVSNGIGTSNSVQAAVD